MMSPQVSSYSAETHPIHVHLYRFLASFLIINPLLGFRRVFDLAMHASVTLASSVCFSSTVLSIGSLAFRAADHLSIIADFLATPEKRPVSENRGYSERAWHRAKDFRGNQGPDHRVR